MEGKHPALRMPFSHFPRKDDEYRKIEYEFGKDPDTVMVSIGKTRLVTAAMIYFLYHIIITWE